MSRWELVKNYVRAGFAPIPVPYSSKNPSRKGWQHERYDESDVEAHFSEDSNIGLLLGDPSGGLVDIDLDCEEAIAAAAVFLPRTGMMHGRASRRCSHYFYICAGEKTERFRDIKSDGSRNGGTIAEIRSTGAQTIVAPSIHPSGEAVIEESDGTPAEVSGEALRRAVGLTAACALIARHWPSEGTKIRHELALALSGWLLRNGLDIGACVKLISHAAEIAGDDEVKDRARAATDTAEALREGSEVIGFPRLVDIWGKSTGEQLVGRLERWLALGSKSDAGDEGLAPSVTQCLLREFDLFHDKKFDCFATIDVGDHQETLAVKSAGFRRFVVKRHYELQGKPPKAGDLTDALELLKARAQFDGAEREIFVRVAGAGETIYIDLANSRGQCVAIDSRGCGIIDDPPVKFLRVRGMEALPIPERGGAVDELRSFMNLEDSDWYLAVALLTAYFRPKGPYPVAVLHGQQGSAKSTVARVLRFLIDPNSAPLRSEPHGTRDLMIAATNAWVVSFDNLSRVRPWLSDGLCRIATGGGFATRALYTDQDEVIIDVQRPIILNGIEDLATRGDLLERSVILYLPPIAESRRRSEREFWSAFDEAKPRIFGAVLETVARALRELSTVQLDRLPRMADFCLWGVAVERALGWPEGSFLEAYEKNRQAANQCAIEGSLIAPLVVDFIRERETWEGTAGELLKELEAIHGENVKRRKSWPSSPRSLSGTLRRLAPNLLAAGVEIEFSREGKSRRRLIRIMFSAASPSASSAPSAVLVNGFEEGTYADAEADGRDRADAKPPSAPVRPSAISASAEASETSTCDEADAADGADGNVGTCSPADYVEGEV